MRWLPFLYFGSSFLFLAYMWVRDIWRDRVAVGIAMAERHANWGVE